MSEESSRIFVRNLPPSVTEADFRKHFGKGHGATITDLKVFPRRRIGYVGYKTVQDASSAVKYFNKSFIRMSRIHVELAQPPQLKDATSNMHPTSKQTASNGNMTSLGNRDGLGDRLTNQEPAARNLKDVTVSGVEDTKKRALPDHDLVDVNAKKRRVETDEDQTHRSMPEDADQSAAAETQPPTMDQDSQAKTDMDWMRSRTSRLLGLQDDEEGEDKDLGDRNNISDDSDTADVLPVVAQEPTPPPERTTTHLQDQALEPPVNPAEDTIRSSRRLFVRNLPYTAQEEDLKKLFSSSGVIEEIHIPLDPKTGDPKGFAFVLFASPDSAVQAYQHLDGTTFQGRLLHVLPASAKRESKLDDYAISQLPIKKQKMFQKKNEAPAAFNWNSLYMNADAVVSSIADRLGVAKSELIDPSSSDAAVKQAQAETHIIQETKAYFESNGVDLDAFSNRQRGDTALLVKNFSYGTSAEELKKLFEDFGDVSKILMPPAGTIAIVEFAQRTQARAAFGSLAYRKYKDSVLFLEKAPKDLFTSVSPSSKTTAATTVSAPGEAPKLSTTDLIESKDEDESTLTTTLFVRNLNFATTNQRLEDVFKPMSGFMSARIKTKTDPKRPNEILSMGFGFVEFRSSEQATAAQTAMNGYNLDGHQLIVKASHKGLDAAEQRRREDREKQQKARKRKIIIKNLPFEATKKDVRALFKSYGQLQSVRMPKKFDNSRKGFAFAEFTTPKEAENAMDALRNTHLLGRRLVLDYAAGEAEDAEKEIERMQAKAGRQANSVALQRLTAASERKKFSLGDADESAD